jgi:cobalt/nickel transport system permease protein
MENRIPDYLLQPEKHQHEIAFERKISLSFLDKTILNSARAVKAIYLQAENAEGQNRIQRIHPYIKVVSLIYLAVVISIAGSLRAQLLTTSSLFVFYILAHLKLAQVFRKIFFLAFIFGFVVVLPASLNIITPGKIVLNLLSLDHPYHIWIYNIPQYIGFTREGLNVVCLVFLRVLNSVSVALLIMYTTPFPAFIKSFKILGIPDTFMMIITLAYKFIIILSRTIEETFFALKSRLMGHIKKSNIRKLVGGRIFFIFKKSMIIYENTYFAMVSRGYQGKVLLSSKRKPNRGDFVALAVVIALGVGIILIG